MLLDAHARLLRPKMYVPLADALPGGRVSEQEKGRGDPPSPESFFLFTDLVVVSRLRCTPQLVVEHLEVSLFPLRGCVMEHIGAEDTSTCFTTNREQEKCQNPRFSYSRSGRETRRQFHPRTGKRDGGSPRPLDTLPPGTYIFVRQRMSG